MAMVAAMVYEMRQAGSGSGGFETGSGGVDYSQQDAPHLTFTDLEVKGAVYTRVYSVTHDASLLATLIGNSIWITAGTNFTTGFYRVIAQGNDGDNYLDVDRNCASGNSNDGAAVLGGAVSDFCDLDSVVVAGNTVWTKSDSDYTLSGAVTIANGSSTAQITIEGYKDTRGDEPEDDDRPLWQAGANAFDAGANNTFKHLRFTTTDADGFDSEIYNILWNVQVRNTQAGPGATGLEASIGVKLVKCDIRSDNGSALTMCYVTQAIFCHIHDSDVGIATFSSYSNFLYCIVEGNTTYGINIDENDGGNLISHCTIDGNGTGIYFGSGTVANLMMNNQITHNTTGLDSSTDPLDVSNIMDHNNWHGNTADMGNTTPKGPHATANDPGYAGAGNFSQVDDMDGFAMELAVG